MLANACESTDAEVRAEITGLRAQDAKANARRISFLVSLLCDRQLRIDRRPFDERPEFPDALLDPEDDGLPFSSIGSA